MLCFTSEERVNITPEFSGQRDFCPGCGGEVVAHCGQILVWHWKHLSGNDCDSWAEEPSPWRTQWQQYLKSLGASLEVFVQKGGKKHRADAILKDGTTIRLQSAGISADKLQMMESFYGKMVWVFDTRKAYETGRINLRDRDTHYTFRWKHPRKSAAYSSKPRRLDLGNGQVFYLEWMSKKTPCGGKGKLKYVRELDEPIPE